MKIAIAYKLTYCNLKIPMELKMYILTASKTPL